MKTDDNYTKTPLQIWLPQSSVARISLKKNKGKSEKKGKPMNGADKHTDSTPNNEKEASADSLSLDVLNLPTRISNTLKKQGLKTIPDIVEKDDKFLLGIQGFGVKCLSFLKNALRKKESIVEMQEQMTDMDIILPPTLSRNDLIEVFGLPVRIENSLKNGADITTAGQLHDATEKQLLKVRNLGYKSVAYLLRIKAEITNKYGNLTESKSVEKTAEVPLENVTFPNNQLVSRLLERCGDERSKEIVKKRYGLADGERHTLEEIGGQFKVTRERIRQIQVKALKRMKHPTSLAKKPLVNLVEEVIFNNGGLISAEEADRLIPEVLGSTSDDGSSVLDLLSDLGEIQSCKIGDIPIYSPHLNGVSLCKLSEKIIGLIKKENLGLNTDSIINQISLFRMINDERFNRQNFVLKYCRTDPRIEEIGLASENKEVIFRHYTSGFAKRAWVDLIIRVLEQEQMPLHFTEITNKVNDLMTYSDRQLDVRRAHSILIEDVSFAHSGIHGTYGLTSWGLRKESTPELVEECLRKAGFPLHWKQIYNYVSKYKDSKTASIISVLENHRMFKKTDSGVYWLRE